MSIGMESWIGSSIGVIQHHQIRINILHVTDCGQLWHCQGIQACVTCTNPVVAHLLYYFNTSILHVQPIKVVAVAHLAIPLTPKLQVASVELLIGLVQCTAVPNGWLKQQLCLTKNVVIHFMRQHAVLWDHMALSLIELLLKAKAPSKIPLEWTLVHLCCMLHSASSAGMPGEAC